MAGVTFTVQFKGLAEFQQCLKDIVTSTQDLSAPMQAMGDRIVEEMQFNCPVDTGLLQSEIQVTEIGVDHMTIESPTAYAGFVNFGTIYQSPQPYFSDAVENLESNGAITDLISDLEDIIDQAVTRNEP